MGGPYKTRGAVTAGGSRSGTHNEEASESTAPQGNPVILVAMENDPDNEPEGPSKKKRKSSVVKPQGVKIMLLRRLFTMISLRVWMEKRFRLVHIRFNNSLAQ